MAHRGFGHPGVLEIVDDFDGDTFRAVYTWTLPRRSMCYMPSKKMQTRRRHTQVRTESDGPTAEESERGLRAMEAGDGCAANSPSWWDSDAKKPWNLVEHLRVPHLAKTLKGSSFPIPPLGTTLPTSSKILSSLGPVRVPPPTVAALPHGPPGTPVNFRLTAVMNPASVPQLGSCQVYAMPRDDHASQM